MKCELAVYFRYLCKVYVFFEKEHNEMIITHAAYAVMFNLKKIRNTKNVIAYFEAAEFLKIMFSIVLRVC